ncbi:MAG: carboxypeptidase-like regulatory domain-containing protein [Vulcanimicrobiaceae bacterium]
MRIVTRTLFCLLSASVLVAAGCGNPNGQGVQEFGTVTGRLLDDRSGEPLRVSPIYISVGSNVVSSVDNQGGFTIKHVPIGKQTIQVNAIGYQSYSFEVNVVKDQTSDAGYVKLKSTLAQ